MCSNLFTLVKSLAAEFCAVWRQSADSQLVQVKQVKLFLCP